VTVTPAITAVRLSGAHNRTELPLLVLGPSLGASATTLWAEAATHLTDVFDVVAWDLPGHGHNRSVPHEQFSLAELATGVLRIVDDLLAERGEVGRPFFYAGDSVGGAVGLQLMLDAPGRIESAVLLGTVPAEFDVGDRLAEIDVPVLAVAGADDVATPTDKMREIADGVQDGRLVVLDGVANLAPAEAPEDVARLMRGHFLGESPASAGRWPEQGRDRRTPARGGGSHLTASFVYAAARTPFGRFGGALAEVRPDDLAAVALAGVLAKAPGLDRASVDEVVWGNANGAGEDNRNVGRMAVLLAGLPVSVPATTVNRLCGSSLDAVMIASRTVETGDAEIVVAGGVESMTRAPWVLPKPSRAFPAGNVTAVSTTLGWRLVNDRMPEEWTVALGEANELLAEKYSIGRERQDEFAARSHNLAAAAWDSGFYDDLVVPVPDVELTRDEGIRPGSSAQKLAGLKPSFRQDGTITPGNASPLNDGASALLIGSEAAAQTLGLEPVARIAGRGAFALEPQLFGFAPVEAAEIALRRAGIGWSDVGAVELNEAFAVQSLACVDAWQVDPEIVNAKGGAIAIGHPLGASGARIVGTLVKRLQESGERWGVAAICIGVGQALAVVLENVQADT